MIPEIIYTQQATIQSRWQKVRAGMNDKTIVIIMLVIFVIVTSAMLWQIYKELCHQHEEILRAWKNRKRLIDADELLKRISDKCKQLNNHDTINGLCGATAIIYDMLIESGQEPDGEGKVRKIK